MRLHVIGDDHLLILINEHEIVAVPVQFGKGYLHRTSPVDPMHSSFFPGMPVHPDRPVFFLLLSINKHIGLLWQDDRK
jgi:hypothetical protein